MIRFVPALMLLPGCGLLFDPRLKPTDAAVDASAEDDASAMDAFFTPDTFLVPDAFAMPDAFAIPDAFAMSDTPIDAPERDAGFDAPSDVGFDAPSDAGTDAPPDAYIDPCEAELCGGDSVFRRAVASAVDVDVSEDGEFVMVMSELSGLPNRRRITVFSHTAGWAEVRPPVDLMPLCDLAAMSDDGTEVLARCGSTLHAISGGSITTVAGASASSIVALAAGGTQFAASMTNGSVRLIRGGVLLPLFAVRCTSAASWRPPTFAASRAIAMRETNERDTCSGAITEFPSIALAGATTAAAPIITTTRGTTFSLLTPDADFARDVAYADGFLASTSVEGVKFGEGNVLSDSRTVSVGLASVDPSHVAVGWVRDVSGVREAWIAPWARAGGSPSAARLRIHPERDGDPRANLQEMRISDCTGSPQTLTAVLRSSTEARIYRVRCPRIMP
jgi:hypothetical protein